MSQQGKNKQLLVRLPWLLEQVAISHKALVVYNNAAEIYTLEAD
jgi:hypothetical protein